MTDKQRLRPQVVLLGFVSLLNDSSSEMIYPLLPVFLASYLGAAPVVIGLIEGGADGLASVLKYFAGAWSDRMPKRKPLIASGYSLAAVSRVLIPLARVWPLVLLARLLDRTGKGIRSAPRDALIAEVTPPESRGKAFGFHRALDHTGAIVGPLIALLLMDGLHVQMRTIFFVAVIPGAIGVFLLLAFLREQRVAPAILPAEERDAGRIAGATQLPSAFWKAVAAVALFSLANSSDAFLLLQAHVAGVATAMLPALWAAHHVIKALFSTRAGALSDRVDRKLLLISGWCSYAVIYFAFPFAHSLTFFVVLFVLYAIPFALYEGAERAWIAEFAPAELRGKGFGYYYLANGLCVLAGTALFGWIYQSIAHTAAFFTGAVLAVAAALWVALLRRAADVPSREAHP
ncbi:MAG TPA: MFS transporter [Thermoanaerobaculia bacterium]|nr:MFS transporter [Thermoanaerobaculia bacterium]